MTSTAAPRKIHPVLLSGGSGSRLWPLSRELYPKQLLQLAGERTMIQDTALRVSEAVRFASPLVVCNEQHRFVIAEQLRVIGTQPRAIVLEPVGRNTAAAVAVGALLATRDDPDALILVLPADHIVQDTASFLDAVGRAAAAAAAGNLVTFGIMPSGPETGYGYIRRGAALEAVEGVYRVAAFVEKPLRDVAEQYVASGEYAWNSGMFLFPASLVLAELERFAPEVLAACRKALDDGQSDLDFFRLDSAAFAAAPSISIDYAVMEKTASAVVVPCEIGWTDVGAWSALWDVGAKDADGNVRLGDVITHDSHNCYVRSENHLAAVVGLDDAVVVVTDDAVLVADKNRVQDVKAVVEQLKRAGRPEPLSHRKVHRPWGSYESLTIGERFQVKCLSVLPGCRLSLQKHHHRAEHWVVVSGTALVTRGEEEILLRENESVYIPLGTVHRLENPGKIPVNIIEVQSGAYLGEDDIVRIEDVYGRA